MAAPTTEAAADDKRVGRRRGWFARWPIWVRVSVLTTTVLAAVLVPTMVLGGTSIGTRGGGHEPGGQMQPGEDRGDDSGQVQTGEQRGEDHEGEDHDGPPDGGSVNDHREDPGHEPGG